MAQIVTITNPLTGQPAQVDQLEHTAQQIDDGLNIARGVSNPNLLDNWYFGNPIDQRQGRVVVPNTTYYSDNTLTTSAGTTSAYVTAYRYATGTANGVSYASFKLEDSDTAPTYYAAPENVVRGYTDAGYGLDRWVFDNDSGNATILITDDGIKFVNNSAAIGIGALRQIIDPALYSALAGKTVTLSVLGKSSKAQQVLFYVNDAVFAVKGSAGGNNARLTTLTATLPQTINNFSIYVYGASEAGAGEGTILGAKLELGSQQTLAHQENGVWVLNEIPNYGEQLARCQRYSEKFLFCNGESSSPVGVRFQNAIGKDADLVTIGAYIYFATQKRTVPVVRIEYDIADGPTQTATVNWIDERCFSSTNIIVPAGQFIDIHWYEAIADL